MSFLHVSDYFRAMQRRNFGWLILLLFFCSGATALVYEIIWSKFLSQMFGSTIYAQTVVLATFMGGLALGNKFFGNLADRLPQPIRAYGYLEIAIGIYAFLFPNLDRLADKIFVSIGSGIAEQTGLLLALKGLLSALLLLGPTILMGGTLPLLCAWLQKTSSDAGRRSALFYSVNSLGAVAGATLAGFWLVQNLGMIASLQMTALVNVLIGATAGILSRRVSILKSGSTLAVPATVVVDSKILRWAGIIVATTGAVSMGLEVLASRALAMIFGSSLQSFAIVLMAFILGIGLGAAWIAAPQRRNAGEKLVIACLCIAAAWVVILVFNIERWIDIYRIARTGLAPTDVGYFYYEIFSIGMSLIILGVPAACNGAVLPLMIRMIANEQELLGTKVGTLLTWNTLGAVAGTLLSGFILMPLFGLRNAFSVLAMALSLAAFAVAIQRRWFFGIGTSIAVCTATICLFASNDVGWKSVISSGVFRLRNEKQFDLTAMPLRKLHTKILFYEDAPDATVSVEEGDGFRTDTGIWSSTERALRINGKADASSESDYSTQLLLGHLPMMVKPNAKDVFVFGLGSGISVGALRAYPIERIVIAENCEPVIRASQFFTNWNHNIVSDPRVHLWREDARTVLKLNPERYDVIVAEPSNPWTVGVGSVFSKEFYQIAANHLKPGGVMAQWFHVYEMHDGIVSLVLRTFCSEFPFVEIWDSNSGDIIMLGSFQPWQTGPQFFKQAFAMQGVREDMAAIGIHSPEALLARQLASQQTAFAVAGKGPIQSDYFPVLEYAAPRAFYIGESSHLLELYDERTRQQSLAPFDKMKILRALPAAEVRSVFAKYGSDNEEFSAALRGDARFPCFLFTNSPSGNSENANPAMAEYFGRIAGREKQLQ